MSIRNHRLFFSLKNVHYTYFASSLIFLFDYLFDY